MDDNREQELKEKTQHCQKTVSSLLEDYESLLLKQMKTTRTTGDSDHSVKTPLVDDAAKLLNDIELAKESIQQGLKLVLGKYLSIQPAFSTSKDCSTIQSDDKQIEEAKVMIDQQVVQSDDNNGSNAAKLIPTVQAHFNGTLPEEVYLLLMSVMGVQDCLISNRLVCSLWNELVLERCRNQRSLKLFESFKILMKYGEILLKYEKTDDTSLILKSIGDDFILEEHETVWQLLPDMHQEDDEDVYEDEDYEVTLTREKKREASKVLTSLFPKVTQLVLCAKYATIVNIEHLLQFYSEQLTSLTITDFWSMDGSGRKLGAFNFPMLKSLHAIDFSPQEDQLLSLLPQLESLALHSSRISLEAILRTGTQLQELNMHNLHSAYTTPVEPFSKCHPIKTNLRKLSFMTTTNVSHTLEFISHNITSLQGLKLYFDCERDNIRHLHLLTSYLLPLHQLHSLTLQAPVSFFLLDDNQFADIQPLPSVRHLKLQLSGYDSLSMDLFSRAIFAAFPQVEQVLIGFKSRSHSVGLVDSESFAAFKDFASKHPKVVQLFRSRKLSRFTSLPNVVSPLLGNHRQLYEERIQIKELFGVNLDKLASLLVTRQDEDRPDLKITLRPTDRFTAMSNLFHLFESKAFYFSTKSNLKIVHSMLENMLKCALKCEQAEGALFMITCKCVLYLLEITVFQENMANFFNDYPDLFVFFKMLLQLVEHYQKQQFKDDALLLLIHNFMDKLTVEMFKKEEYQDVISIFIFGKDSVHRVETARAILRFSEKNK